MTRLAALACSALLLAAPAFPAAPRGSLPSEKQDWIRLETDQFSLFSNAGERRTANLARGLEQLREVLEGWIAFGAPPARCNRGEISKSLLSKILRQAGIDADDWIQV